MIDLTKPAHRPVLLIRLAFLLALASASAGTTVRAATRHVPGEYPNIQDAIDHSVAGDTVFLSPGIFQGTGNHDIVLRGRNIVITADPTAQPAIIDCQSLGRGFWVHEGESPAARIENITIRNGEAPSHPAPEGGAILIGSNTSPTIVNCKLISNYARRGGGLSLTGSSSLVDGCVIAGNLAASEGGGIMASLPLGQVRNTVITGNWSYEGGGITCDAGFAWLLKGCTIAGNVATYGGGVFCGNGFPMEECILWDNCAFDSDDELFGAGDFHCCAVDTTGLRTQYSDFDNYCVYTNPRFCGPHPCSYEVGGDWTLDRESPCLPEHSPCGQLIGALGQGCGAPPVTGACCLPDGSCVVVQRPQCEDQQGTYMGDGVSCHPNPCQPVPVQETTWGRIKSRFRDATR